MRSWISFFAGASMSLALFGLHQDSYGSLDGYCAWLRQPGHWVDGRWTCITWLVINSVVMGGVAVSHFRELRSSRSY